MGQKDMEMEMGEEGEPTKGSRKEEEGWRKN
jgi:hypothetical protein